MKKKLLAVFMSVCMCCMSACGSGTDSTESVEIYDAEEIKYDTYTVELGVIKEAYYAKAEFDYPYSENIFIMQNGIITKMFNGTEIEAGAVICEQIVDGLQEQIEEQKLILDAAEETYTSLKNSGASANDIEYAQINYQLEKNAYDKLMKKQEEATVYAPFSGNIRIETEGCYAGAQVYDGQYLATITDKSQSYLCSFVYGDKLENVNFGSSVTIKQGAIVECSGMVVDIIERDGGTDYAGFLYVIEPEEDSGLKDFGTIDVIFDVYEKDNVVVVPHSAVKQVGGRTYVNVLIGGNKIETDVELGIEGADEIEILSGLYGGEQLIINR